MIESRRLQRVPINQLAMLHLDGIPGIHPCLVRDFHDQGAGLELRWSRIFAKRFDLSFDGFKTTKRCRLVWQNKNVCGVEFIDRIMDRQQQSARR
jgi:hypothetical protein